MAKAKPLPPVEVLREHFSYDPETGIVTRIKAGKTRPDMLGPVGSRVKSGHLHVKFNGKSLKLHRLAWKLQTGVEAPDFIDHRNRCPSDNRWKNLRAATRTQNGGNKIKYRGKWMAGVYPCGSKWLARGRAKWIGTYGTEQDAHDAYVKWHRETYGEFSAYAV